MKKADPNDADIVRSAAQLLERHGKDAVIIAEMHAQEFMGAGDLDGYRMWKRLAMLVDGLLPNEGPRGLPH